MVVFDANFVLFLLNPSISAPYIPGTKDVVPNCAKKIEFLLEGIQKRRDKIIIPTPVLSEVLIEAGNAAPEYTEKLRKSSHFNIVPFDDKSAIEASLIIAQAIKDGDKKRGSSDSWSKVKYDIQILAIAISSQAKTLYTNDKGLTNQARSKNLEVIGVHQLPDPPEDNQMDFKY